MQEYFQKGEISNEPTWKTLPKNNDCRAQFTVDEVDVLFYRCVVYVCSAGYPDPIRLILHNISEKVIHELSSVMKLISQTLTLIFLKKYSLLYD